MEDLYSKNLNALKIVDTPLYEELKKIQTNEKYEVFTTSEEENLNILDIERESWVCHNEAEDFKIRQEETIRLREYPFLYFYGFGNGRMIANLLKNEKLKQIIMIEPDMEMIYVAFNLIDFSEDLLSGRLVVIPQEAFSFGKAIEIFHTLNAKFYTRQFKLHVVSNYYLEKRITDYKAVSDIFLGTIEHIIKAFGNDIGDSLVGLKHHIKNLPRMVSHPKYSELCAKKNSDLAVIVSTGPSLYKQLETLKEIADYVTIVSVDASLPILSKYGIRPDIVVSMERDALTSKFFKETTKEDHKDIVFLCASVQHESVFNAIKDGQLLLSMRPFAYNYYFELEDYGYVCAGMSSANMAHELVGRMAFRTCAFIGQDLAYGKDGASHSKGHVFGADQIKDGINTCNENAKYETIKLPAYGNKGTVDTMMFWEIFLRYIEQYIEQTGHYMQTINATEGGVHMKGSTEMPFKEVAEKFCLKDKKQPLLLTEPSAEEIEQSMIQIKNKIKSILVGGKSLQKKVEKTFVLLANECKVLENIEKEEAIKAFDLGKTVFLLEEISAIRKELEQSSVFTDFISSISQSILFHEEFKLAQIKVIYVDNPEDNQLKALQWILAHRYWLFSLGGIIENILHIVEEESQPYMD